MSERQVCSIEWCGKVCRIGSLCLGHHDRLKRHGSVLSGKALPGEPEAFVRFVAANPNDDCVLWPFAVDRLGYGKLAFEGRPRPAHRLAWEFHNGRPMRADLDACHAPEICHNRSCINPRHIRPDTRANNMADTRADGTCQRGERSAVAKLTEKQVVSIFWDTRNQNTVAKTFGVSRDTVKSIRNGRRWGWLTANLTPPQQQGGR